MNMIGICGDNCTHCPRYIATRNNSTRELDKVKELWIRLGLRDSAFPVQDLICHGCRPGNKCAYQELRSCVNTKEVENCGLCAEYPCKITKTAFEKSAKLKSHAEKVCTQEEMDTLNKAFFSKKECFDHIHQKHRKKT